MAEPKKKDAKKIIDVSHPGKTAPSGNSKSVIVSSRPIMKDPMMVEETEKPQDNSTEKISTKTGEAVITPLGEIKEDKPESRAKADDKPAKPELKQEDDKKTIAVLAEEAAVKKEENDDAPEGEEESEESSTAESEEPTSEPDEAKLTDEPAAKPEQDKPEDNKTDIDTDENATSKTVTEADEAELVEKEKKDAAIQKLIDSKQYELPIITVEKRRSRRVVILGILLSLFLIGAWADIALDSGIVQVSGVPHTHLFDQQTTTTADPVPAASLKKYDAKVSKLTFRYPSNWKVIDSGSATADLLYIDTAKPKNESLEIGSIIPSFASPEIADSSVDADAKDITVLAVNYQKLKKQINDKDVYLRDLVYQSPTTGAIYLSGSLTNDNTVKINAKLPNVYGSFNTSNGVNSRFTVTVFKFTNKKSGFVTVENAQNYIKNADYQKARAMLLSTAPTK